MCFFQEGGITGGPIAGWAYKREGSGFYGI